MACKVIWAAGFFFIGNYKCIRDIWRCYRQLWWQFLLVQKAWNWFFFLVNCVTWHFYMLLCTLSHGEAFSFIVHSSGQQKQHLPLNVHQWSINSCLGEADSLNWPVRSRLKASLLPAPLTYGDKWTPACIVLLTRSHSVSLVFVTGPMVGRCKWDRAFRRGGLCLFPFWLFIAFALPYFVAAVCKFLFAVHKNIPLCPEGVFKQKFEWSKLFVFVSWMNDFWPATFPWEGSGRAFLGFGIRLGSGWRDGVGLDDR